jgi:P4 family phage/plasmid primase-like protien
VVAEIEDLTHHTKRAARGDPAARQFTNDSRHLERTKPSMSSKSTEKQSPRQRVEKSVPPWAWPGLMRLGRESKVPTGLEKDYTTKCARRYEQAAAADWDSEPRITELAEHLEAGGNIGWVPPVGVMVVDCDNSQAVAFVEPRRSKTTPIQRRRPEKQHYYFSYDPETFNVYTRNGIKIDIKSNEPAMIDLKTCGNVDPKVPGGGYAVVPPSLHNEDADHPYKWKRKLPADRTKIPEISLDLRNALAPWLKRGKKVDRVDSRHDRVLRYQQRLVIEAREDSDDVREEIVDQTRAMVAELYSDDPARMADELDGVEREYDGAARHDAAFQGHVLDGSDESLASMIINHYGDGMSYAAEDGQWRGWDGELWSNESPHSVRRAIGDYHRVLLTDAAVERDDDRQERMMKEAFKLKGVHAVKRVFARMEDTLVEALDEFDSNINLVTFPSDEHNDAMTMDTETGEVMPPDMSHRITRSLGAPYRPHATHPMVTRFFEESFPDPDTRRCVLMALGMSLLGRMPVERFYFMHGKGASGKGTLAAAMDAALGGYATVLDPSSVSGNGGIDGSRNAPDLFALRGVRFAFVDEIAPSRLLGSRLKNLTQDGRVTAAGKYMKQTTFPITWSIWIAGNARPKIDPTDKGLMRRIVEVPMDRGAVDNDHIDWRVKDVLKRDPDARAAFMWALVEGLNEARTFDFRPPISAEMRAATDEWIELSDMIGPWLADRVELTNNMDDSEMSSKLFGDYEEWMDQTYGFRSRGTVPRATPNQFAEGLKSRGLVKVKRAKGYFWTGVRLGRGASEEGAAPEPRLKSV